jgi:hypothetical protein
MRMIDCRMPSDNISIPRDEDPSAGAFFDNLEVTQD